MRIAKLFAAAGAVAMVSGCGGGGGGGGGGAPSGAAPPPTATLPVTLSAASANVTVDEGQSQTFGFTASYTGTSSSPIVADVQVGDRRYALNGTPTASGTSFNVSLKTVPLPAGGARTSTVTFRLCTSAACSTVYPGSTQTFTVNLDVRLKDWATFQRDAAHTGYVAASYNSADFANAWTIDTPFPPSEIAARRGSVFVNVPQRDGGILTQALDPASGNVSWTYNLGTVPFFSAPSFANGLVSSMTVDLPPGSVQAVSADTGRELGFVTTSGEFTGGGTPTPFGGLLYFQAGSFGNVVYAGDVARSGQIWAQDTTQPGEGFVDQWESIAVDENYAYYFNGGNLFALSRATGAIAYKIRNPYFSQFGVNYFGIYRGAPILDDAGRIFTFSDNRDAQTPLPLLAFSLSSATPLWRTSATYVGQPALHDGTLYAIRANSAIIDLINTADGTVSGSIDLGSGRGPLSSNVIVTGSHLFVASDTATYAVDLTQSTHAVVWSAPVGGALAITPDNLLVVSATNGISAFRLAS